MRSSSMITLGDMLSSAAQANMGRLRDDLKRQARLTIQDQLAKPKAPWQQAQRTVASTPRTPSRPANKRVLRHKQAMKKVAPRPIPVARRLLPLLEKRQAQAPIRQTRAQPAPFEFWDLPPEAAVREPPPDAISPQNYADFERLISAGSPPAPGAAGQELFVTIGLDFGTSATKVIVRFPYEVATPTIAIPAPVPCKSTGHPYLWQSVLWVDQRGEFKPWPDRDAHLLYALKQGVTGAYPDNALPGGPTRAEAAAAFLAFVIRHTRGWLLDHRPNIFRRRQPVWFVNVGLPAANFDNLVLASTYRRVAATALALANFQNAITVEATRLFLANPHVRAAAQSSVEAEALGVAIIPETAAEVAGFAKSTSRARGLYLMVDVGAMTLDICTFRLGERSMAENLYVLLLALVPPLGVEAYHWFLAQGKTETGFVEQANHALHRVVWNTKRARDPYAQCWKEGNDLPVFLVGGGAKNDLHRRLINGLDPWLRQQARNGGMRMLELPIPGNIELPVPISDFGRLAVAWGLRAR